MIFFASQCRQHSLQSILKLAAAAAVFYFFAINHFICIVIATCIAIQKTDTITVYQLK
jgi:hypothetical protein